MYVFHTSSSDINLFVIIHIIIEETGKGGKYCSRLLGQYLAHPKFKMDCLMKITHFCSLSAYQLVSKQETVTCHFSRLPSFLNNSYCNYDANSQDPELHEFPCSTTS